MVELVRQFLGAKQDARSVVADPRADYFGGIPVDDRSLVPGAHPRLGKAGFRDGRQRGCQGLVGI
jgi:hypothetical protein